MTLSPFRWRIALLSSLISGFVLLLFGTAAWHVIQNERVAALDREIRALAYRHPGWMGNRGNYERLSSVIEMVFGQDRKEQLILLITDTNRTQRYISPHWPVDLDPNRLILDLEEHPLSDSTEEKAQSQGNTNLPVPSFSPRGPPWAAELGEPRSPGSAALSAITLHPRFYTLITPSSSWRFGIMGNREDRLVIGLNLSEMQAELGRLRNAFGGALPFALVIVGSGGWWIAGRAMRPLRSIVQIAERVTAQGLDQRIPSSQEDPEIARLIGVLNGMMDRLQLSFKQATRFSADASHELKTPLTIMQGEMEAALQVAIPGSKEQKLFSDLLEEIQRLKTITQSLLLLAQADAGHLPLSLASLNLSTRLYGLVEDLAVLAHSSGLRLQLNLIPQAWVQADWPLLQQAIFNLLTNAVRYNEEKGQIQIRLSAHPTEVTLEVCNSGPGIPSADQSKLFNRFFRADSSRNRQAGGVGLGLSLAREIVRAHGGNLYLKESRPGHTCFELSLPASPPKN